MLELLAVMLFICVDDEEINRSLFVKLGLFPLFLLIVGEVKTTHIAFLNSSLMS